MIKLLFLTFTFSHFAFSNCEINLYSHILKLRNSIDESIIKTSNCSAETKNSFLHFISNFDSPIKANHLMAAFKSEINVNVTLKPATININSLEKLVYSELNNPNLLLKDISTLHSSSSINSDNSIVAQVVCNDCSSVGRKNFKLKTQNESLWISADFNEKTFALISNEPLNPNTNDLSDTQFTKKEIIYGGESHLFTDFQNIRFYKVMRPIKTNQPISSLDVTPKILVEANKLVDVIFKNDSLELKGKALARQSGRLGQNIELYNPKTKKRINATAIDYNKVMVNL